MKCFKCGQHYTSAMNREMREPAKGSPSRGKNMKWVLIKYKHYTCSNCGSSECEYSEPIPIK